jgi:hypothetical protein
MIDLVQRTIMTQLTYRGTRYYKEDQAETDRLDWNNRHRPQLFLRYRTLRYRPYQTGGQVPSPF